MATHPVILEVSRKLLGDKCRLSSLSANSVLPGMEGQDPHLDYPYYRHLWPSKEGCMDLPATHMLCLQVKNQEYLYRRISEQFQAQT